MRAAQPEPGVGDRRCWPTIPTKSADAVADLNAVVGDVQRLRRRQPRGAGHDVGQAGVGHHRPSTDSLDDIKQMLHVAPNAFQNFVNIYQPAQGALTGVLALNNFANPITFLCGAIQAASRLGAEQSAKLCVQYLAPIIKNRQYNFLPIGQNPFVGAAGPAERDHLQRGLDAPGLHSAADRRPATAAADAPRRWRADARPRARRCPPRRRIATESRRRACPA